ncbi:MAG: hypothetical protein Q9170_000524 [Blastenia crenularia]
MIISKTLSTQARFFEWLILQGNIWSQYQYGSARYLCGPFKRSLCPGIFGYCVSSSKYYNGDPDADHVEGEDYKPGIFQKPKRDNSTTPNIWRAYELPTLQRNTAIVQVVSVDLANAEPGETAPYTQRTDWHTNGPAKLMDIDDVQPKSNASLIPIPNASSKRRFTQTDDMTRCSEKAIEVDKIPYKNPADSLLDHGHLEIRVQASQYNTTSLRDAMTNSASITAMQSATGNNCYIEHYYVQEPMKRYLPSSTWPCRTRSRRPDTDPQSTNMYIDAAWEVELPPDSGFVCDFLAEAVDMLAAVAPEFTVGDVELGEAITVACELAMDHGGD